MTQPTAEDLRDVLKRMVLLAPYTSFLGAYEQEWLDLLIKVGAALAAGAPEVRAGGDSVVHPVETDGTCPAAADGGSAT